MVPRISRFEGALSRAMKAGRPLLLDGATGTELDNRGADTTSPVWSGLAPLNHPTLLFEIHRDYVTAGAEVITAATFRTTDRAFRRAGLEQGRWRNAASEAVAIARKAAPTVLVAGSVGPLEDCFSPASAPRGDAAYSEHIGLIRHLVEADVDVLWLETFGTLGELRAAGQAARDIGTPRGIPFAVSVTTLADGRLLSGEPLVDALTAASTLGAKAFSVNCVPVGHVDAALTALECARPFPIGAYANLGVPEETQDWSGSAFLTPEEYARAAAHWRTDIVGACCGSTPDHIRALKNRFTS